jgi:hypothetical protein
VEYEQSLSASRSRAPASGSNAGTPAGAPASNERSRSIGVPDADQDKPRDTTGQGRFVPVFREVKAGEQRIEGVLERIDCPAGAPVRFMVREASGLTPIEAARLADVDFISYRDDLTGGVGCGPFKEPMRVYIAWREGPAPARPKTVVAVEFLPRN